MHLFKLSADGKSLVGPSTVIHQSPGSEANKLYKIDGIYYHLFSEVKSEGRVLMMNRGSSLYGPYRAAARDSAVFVLTGVVGVAVSRKE